MSSNRKIGSINLHSVLASRIISACGESPNILDGIIKARTNERKIVQRLDSEFRAQCTGELGEYLTYEGYEVVSIESELKIKTVSTKETLSVPYRFKFIKKEFDPKIGDFVYEDKEIIQDIPSPYKKHFMKINGHIYFAMFQLADIIYKTKDSCVVKTLLTPVKLARPTVGRRKYTSCDGKEIVLEHPYYVLDMLKKPTEFIKLFFAKMGVPETFEYFGLTGTISFVNVASIPDRDDVTCFKMNKEVVVCVSLEALKDKLFCGFLSTLLRIAKRNMTIYDVYNHHYWKCVLGEIFGRPDKSEEEMKIESCERTLKILEKTMEDEDTAFHLGLYAGSQGESADLYAVMRWLFMNFSKLIHNDNLHIKNKRLRLNEYMVIPVIRRFQDRKNNFLKSRDPMKLNDIFKMSADTLMKEGVENNGVSRYVGLINDNIMLHVLMVTSSGPSAHGGASSEKKTRKHTIPTHNLFVHPSHLGVFDTTFAPAGSAGMNQIITPGVEITSRGVIKSSIPGDVN